MIYLYFLIFYKTSLIHRGKSYELKEQFPYQLFIFFATLKIIIILFILSFCFASTVHAKGKLKNAYVEWQAVQGAVEYRVEVKNSKNKIIIKKKTKKTKLDLKITPGDYKYRVGIVNKFYSVFAWSKWEKLSIISAKRHKPYHHIGIEGGYHLMMTPIDNSYSGYGGGGLFYEIHALFKKAPSIFFGISASYFQFIFPNSDFGISWMVIGSLYIGYEFKFNFSKTFFIRLSPVISGKYYYREHLYNGTTYYGYRPILSAGFHVSYDLSESLLLTLKIEYDVILDVTPIQTISFYGRIAYRFQ